MHGHVGRGLHPGRDGEQPADLSGEELPRPDPQDHRGAGNANHKRHRLHRESQGQGLSMVAAKEVKSPVGQVDV